METSFFLDSKAKRLNLAFKKKYVHNSDAVLTIKGHLDTTNAAAVVNTSLEKFVYIGQPTAGAEEAYQPETRLRLGLGAKASNTSEDVLLSVSAKKKTVLRRSQHVLRNKIVLTGYTQAVARANYDYNPKRDAWAGEASASLSHAIFRFTEDQDLRLTAGVRAPLSPAGVGQPEPFLRLQENCWSLNVDRHGAWSINYDL